MYVWRLCFAVILGLIWYFSDYGRTLAQYFLCAFFCLLTPLIVTNLGQESGTQTDEEDHPHQESAEQTSGSSADGACSSRQQAEILASQYPHVKRSLQQVFQCAYARLVQPWYSVPEPCELQPLHRVLSREFDFVIGRIIQRSKDFDLCQAVVGSIRILTLHLHNAKQSDREPLFGSRCEEIAVLREFAEAVVRNLFTESLRCQEVNRCALKEIIALKGLELAVTWLSDPDNLNQLVVSQLDSLTPKSSVEDLRGSDQERMGRKASRGEDDGDEGDDDEEEEEEEGEDDESGLASAAGAAKASKPRIKGKKRGSRNRLKEGWAKFVDKMKSKKAKKKKMKKMEQELVARIMSLQGDVSNEYNDSGGDSSSGGGEGSGSSRQDSDEEDSDLEEYLTSVQEDMMEFKLSYEMWRVGSWAVSVPSAEWRDEELVLTLHLEEADSPENLQWDIKKPYMEVIYFRNRWQDYNRLPELSPVEVPELSEVVKEEARQSAERFLQALVSDKQTGHTQPVFQFLCPLDKLLNEEEHHGGVWSLLSGLAYFLTPGQEEEEDSGPHPENVTSQNPNSTSQPPEEERTGRVDKTVSSQAIPSIVISDCEPGEEEAETEQHSDKSEDSDRPITSHLKMLFRGLARSKSQESLSSAKHANEDGANGAPESEIAEGPSWRGLIGKSNKRERAASVGAAVGEQQQQQEATIAAEGDESHLLKSQASWEQHEATKAIFDLLKEISGNSILLNIFDAILKPVMPILKKKVNSFLSKLNPTESQMAAYVDAMREKQWPERAPARPSPPRSEEEKMETRERAHHLINSKYSNYLILKKTDVESVFNLFQDRQENKTLAYMLLSFLLREFLPDEQFPNVTPAALQKATNPAV